MRGWPRGFPAKAARHHEVEGTGGNAMTSAIRSLDVSAEQRAAAELVKRIRKLRWIGQDDEATLLQSQLASRVEVATDTVVAVPRDTD
jgi:hypothetical protein